MLQTKHNETCERSIFFITHLHTTLPVCCFAVVILLGEFSSIYFKYGVRYKIFIPNENSKTCRDVTK